VSAASADSTEAPDGPDPARASPLPPWLQPQTVRLVVSGLILVYLVGILVDLRTDNTVIATEAAVLAIIVVLFLLTVRWWEPTGKPTPKRRSRQFVLLAGLALLVQLVGVVAESADPNDLANNSAGLLLLAILFFNTIV